MRGTPGRFVTIVVAMLLACTGTALAEAGPTRAEYVSMVEPICKSNTEANQQILQGTRAKIRNGNLPSAGRQFTRASRAFGRAVTKIVSVPRPPADAQRLVSWFSFLRIVRENLRKFGVALKEDDRVKANHERIRIERSANAANNVSSIFPFRYCRLTASRFSGT